ncbi:ACT domain-containing protein [Candidatus Daviesbacteria bacterium]|nr:ACT domain-containing protein [Candidatus Daviesbacteria bacterium]
MNDELKNIIKQSSFETEDGVYVYTQVKSVPETEKHFMVSQDKDEITVVTKEENLSSLDLIERNKDNYKLIALNVSVPFYSVGFLATVSSAIAKAGMNILIISTYSKDYILVKEDKLRKVKEALLALGFKGPK